MKVGTLCLFIYWLVSTFQEKVKVKSTRLIGPCEANIAVVHDVAEDTVLEGLKISTHK